MAKKVTVHAALIYVMVMVSAADGEMPEAELKRIGWLTQFLPAFRDFDPDLFIPTTRDIQEILSGAEGMDIALETIKDALPPRLYDTAYALAIEIASVDLRYDPTEIRLLQLLRDRLNIDKLTSAAIERSAGARYRVA